MHRIMQIWYVNRPYSISWKRYLSIPAWSIHESCEKGVKPANYERRISQEIFMEGQENGSRYRLNFVFTTSRSKDASALSFLRLVPPDYHRNRSSKSSSNLGTSCPRCFSRYARVITKEIVSFARNRLWEVTESGIGGAWKVLPFWPGKCMGYEFYDIHRVLIYSYRYPLEGWLIYIRKLRFIEW